MRPMRTHLSDESLSLIGVPKNLRHKNIEDFETFSNKELAKVKMFIADYIYHMTENFAENMGIFLYGSNGVGKTFLASVLVKEAYRRRYSAKRTTFVEYLSAYTEMWGCKNSDERLQKEENFYSYFKSVEFLVLEEVGKEIDSKIATPILEDLLRHREDKGFVTVLCSNLTPQIIEQKYGASVFSLLKGNMTPIKIEGIDKRNHFYQERGD